MWLVFYFYQIVLAWRLNMWVQVLSLCFPDQPLGLQFLLCETGIIAAFPSWSCSEHLTQCLAYSSAQEEEKWHYYRLLFIISNPSSAVQLNSTISSRDCWVPGSGDSMVNKPPGGLSLCSLGAPSLSVEGFQGQKQAMYRGWCMPGRKGSPEMC